MRMNTDMSTEAAEWAEHLASTGMVKQSNKKSENAEGENIMEICGMSPASVVEESTTLW